MYKFVLNIPVSILALIIYSRIVIYIMDFHAPISFLLIWSFLSLLCGLAWLVGVNAYTNKALEKNETDFITILLCMFFLPGLYEVFAPFFGGDSLLASSRNTKMIFLIVYVCILFLLTLKVRKILFERSVWFMLLELIFYPFGILTLTPEIRDHYNENKSKMDKNFAGAHDEEILNP